MSEPASSTAAASPRHRTATREFFAPVRSLWHLWSRVIFSLGEERLFLLLAVLIGIFSGMAVVCFRVAIEFTTFLLLGSSLSPSIARVILAPALAGLAIGLLALEVFPRSRGSGVNQTKLAVYVLNGYISFRTVISKFLMCALAMGSGQSLGPEDPSLQMGAGIASAIGRGLKLSQRKVRLIAPVGAAAGLAAALNAPISAVLFVIEEVIGNWSAGVLGAIVLAAISSVVTMRVFLGRESLFRVPPFQLVHPWEVLAYVVLGVIGGFLSLAFLKWIAYARPRIHALPGWTRYVQPAAAGLLIGLIGIRLPQVMGAGYAVIDEALHGQFTLKLLIALALLKIVVTGISFLSGTPGGMFAPALFIGAMLGGAVGTVEQHIFPHLTGTVATFALVGMGTFFSGFLRVPITSVFLVIELSGSYTAVLPVMISTLVAYFISRRYQKVALFDLLARQDGLVLPSIEERREHLRLVVEDAMRPTSEAIIVLPDEPVAEIARRIEERQGKAADALKRAETGVGSASAVGGSAKAEAKSRTPLLCRMKPGEWRLLDQDHIMRVAGELRAVDSTGVKPDSADSRASSAPNSGNGLRTGSQADSKLGQGEHMLERKEDHRTKSPNPEQLEFISGGADEAEASSGVMRQVTAANIKYKGPLPLIFPDESLEEVLRWAGDWPVLAVVNRADLGQLEGILALADILRAFRQATTD
jgi:chloride channel protein, CIC family